MDNSTPEDRFVNNILNRDTSLSPHDYFNAKLLQYINEKNSNLTVTDRALTKREASKKLYNFLQERFYRERYVPQHTEESLRSCKACLNAIEHIGGVINADLSSWLDNQRAELAELGRSSEEAKERIRTHFFEDSRGQQTSISPSAPPLAEVYPEDKIPSLVSRSGILTVPPATTEHDLSGFAPRAGLSTSGGGSGGVLPIATPVGDLELTRGRSVSDISQDVTDAVEIVESKPSRKIRM